jgi:hypothetical protein
MLAARPRGDRPLVRGLTPDAGSLQRSTDDAVRSLRALIESELSKRDATIARLEATISSHEARIAALEAGP